MLVLLLQIEQLLSRKDNAVDVNAPSGPSGRTALHAAAASGSVAACQALLSHGADSNCADDDNASPLMLAAAGGHEGVVKVGGLGNDVCRAQQSRGRRGFAHMLLCSQRCSACVHWNTYIHALLSSRPLVQRVIPAVAAVAVTVAAAAGTGAPGGRRRPLACRLQGCQPAHVCSTLWQQRLHQAAAVKGCGCRLRQQRAGWGRTCAAAGC